MFFDAQLFNNQVRTRKTNEIAKQSNHRCRATPSYVIGPFLSRLLQAEIEKNSYETQKKTKQNKNKRDKKERMTSRRFKGTNF